MGIFTRFYKSSGNIAFEDLFCRIDETGRYSNMVDEIFEEVHNWDDANKSEVIVHILENYHKIRESRRSYNPRKDTFALTIEKVCTERIDYGANLHIILELIRVDIKKRVMGNASDDYKNSFQYIVKPLLDNMVRFNLFKNRELMDSLVAIRAQLDILNSQHHSDNKEISLLLQKIDETIFINNDSDGNAIIPTYFIGSDAFKDFANDIVDRQTEYDKNLWYKLIAIAQKASGSKPSQKFLNETKAIIDDLGSEKFKKVVHEWVSFVTELEDNTTTRTKRFFIWTFALESVEFINSLNSDALKAFVWMSSWFHDNKTIQSVSQLAERSFRKIPKKGPASVALGNACLYTLYASKGLDGIAQLSKLKFKLKHKSIIDLIEKYLNEAANKKGVSSWEIEDLAVSEFQLQDHKITAEFGDFKGVIELTGIGKSSLRWIKRDGSVQKSVPKLVKDKFSEKLKAFKEKQRQINQTTSVQKERLDRMLRSSRLMDLEYFKEKYIDHGLLSFVVNNVIFNFSKEKEAMQAIYLKKQWIGLDSKRVDIECFTHASLWHPVNSNTSEVKDWRQFLMDYQIQQPFKQAFREIYLLTEAEIKTGTYSNRMASHVLKQHQYVTLAKARNWKARLISAWGGGNHDTAELNMPEHNLKVEYWINGLNAEDQFSDAGICYYVTTDKIRFKTADTNELLELTKVPNVAFSEAMRDVDLFVGVASVGNDPTWRDSGGLPNYRNYWQSYAFGDLSEIAKNRKEILLDLIPKLKIATVTQIKGNYVVVKGKLRTYKIHIGSTNILMKPNDQYLCIVPDRSKKSEISNLFLPFEGDYGLSVIISKAFLLANDDKITDTEITSQINWN